MCTPQNNFSTATQSGREYNIGNNRSLNICRSLDEGPRELARANSIHWPSLKNVRDWNTHTEPTLDQEDNMIDHYNIVQPVPAGHHYPFFEGPTTILLPSH
jgi:hypothetical protein